MHADDQLNGNLKRAVDAVKGTQAPPDTVAKSVRRAARIEPPRNVWSQRTRSLIAAGAIAATLLLSLLLNLVPPQQGSVRDSGKVIDDPHMIAIMGDRIVI